MLVVHPPKELPAYWLTLRDAANGRELWSYALQPDEDLALTILLPEGLRPGRYRLEIADGAGREVLETRPFRVVESSRGE